MPPAPRKPRVRTYDPAKVRAALEGQVRAVRDVVTVACTEPDAQRLLAGRTRVGEWTVRELIVHLVGALELLPHRLAERAAVPARAEAGLFDYVNGLGSQAAHVAATTAEGAAAFASADPNAVADRLDRAGEGLLGAAAETDPASLVPTAFGAMTVADFLLTRLVELVVHADDLADATGIAVRHDRQALATVTRLLTDALAVKAPGGSVEVRVPPFAVVQCVAGPKHTRGTPPNVVETDPLTWIRLATGRADWAVSLAEAAVTASGERADISEQLPLLT
ncbi:sterol carrier family protein [Streptomyces sp. SCA3-4]|uniref:sterol carrier family protein n=1 Tax=Streptomyces sichuanensis TaxID=2871810 RepID=UPI001CE323BA|nr:sterol carrier family protein [Streptomyces sichuanensis]MCA6096418.1 sterol carrier family protein [Streptomyces sichuanensis]